MKRLTGKVRRLEGRCRVLRNAFGRLRHLFQVSELLPSSSKFSTLTRSWGNWQYQAGVGNDARASRQFNPIKQARDYDAKGQYVRLWLPELKNVSDEQVQTPWRGSCSSTFRDFC